MVTPLLNPLAAYGLDEQATHRRQMALYDGKSLEPVDDIWIEHEKKMEEERDRGYSSYL